MDSPGNFENSIKRLENIVKELEGGDVEIEKALDLFEEGTRLSKMCATKLAAVERRVEILKKGSKEDDVLELFQGMDEG
ncbi:MAG TPA: exodeoxyribonuclease VII small subunit [Spirochaetes bacterium]|nr:exodeoxyribonuclease VII small subunit [Spirochaetota bacterium]